MTGSQRCAWMPYISPVVGYAEEASVYSKRWITRGLSALMEARHAPHWKAARSAMHYADRGVQYFVSKTSTASMLFANKAYSTSRKETSGSEIDSGSKGWARLARGKDFC